MKIQMNVKQIVLVKLKMLLPDHEAYIEQKKAGENETFLDECLKEGLVRLARTHITILQFDYKLTRYGYEAIKQS